MRYFEQLSREPAQTERADARQARNDAGGYSFVVGPFERLERFLILGSEGGSYYASERELTLEGAAAVVRALELDALRTVKTIVEISQWARAPKQSPGLFALAIAASAIEPETRRLALAALPLVCRTASTLFEFLAAVDRLRGWGGGLRRAVGEWYVRRGADDLAYQVLKYRQRSGWTHRDVLRLAHVPDGRWSPAARALVRWVVAGRAGLGERCVERRVPSGRRSEQQPIVGEPPELVSAFERLAELAAAGAVEGGAAEGEREAIALIERYRMPHEMVPDDFKRSAGVWAALARHMPLGALVRHLGKLSAVGWLTPGSAAAEEVSKRLASVPAIRKSRLHPMAFLCALSVYAQGHGERGKLHWTPASEVCAALESSFYRAFVNVEPTGQRLCIALDISSSMQSGSVSGVPGLTPARAAAALALVALKTEPEAVVLGFSHSLVRLALRPDMGLEEAMELASSLPFGGTDCSLPILQATREKAQIDGFIVLTDSETWAGSVHPHTALQQYRQWSGRSARLVVVSLVGSDFSIADPSDAGMLDVVGFDARTPSVVSEFLRGKRTGSLESGQEPVDEG